VRANNVDAVREWDKKIDRAFRSGAMAIGAKVNIVTIPGYLPLNNNVGLMGVYKDNAVEIVGEGHIGTTGHRTGSTDMGDISQIIPTIHPYSGGATGIGHGADYLVQDWEQAVINPTKVMAMTSANGSSRTALMNRNAEQTTQAARNKCTLGFMIRKLRKPPARQINTPIATKIKDERRNRICPAG